MQVGEKAREGALAAFGFWANFALAATTVLNFYFRVGSHDGQFTWIFIYF